MATHIADELEPYDTVEKLAEQFVQKVSDDCKEKEPIGQTVQGELPLDENCPGRQRITQSAMEGEPEASVPRPEGQAKHELLRAED